MMLFAVREANTKRAIGFYWLGEDADDPIKRLGELVGEYYYGDVSPEYQKPIVPVEFAEVDGDCGDITFATDARLGVQHWESAGIVEGMMKPGKEYEQFCASVSFGGVLALYAGMEDIPGEDWAPLSVPPAPVD